MTENGEPEIEVDSRVAMPRPKVVDAVQQQF
jgi:hypothetical protein